MGVKQDSILVAKGKLETIEIPQSSDWECELFGMGQNGIKIVPAVGNVPNAFWRWMQYLAFGNRWRRRK
ncbi:MAG: hypothetical protein EBR82_53860 [Caulobacteraceae bacterium]|jgi:hypothetical protein|nr:hypothetical protein [Caulobacteraceae bacterium]